MAPQRKSLCLRDALVMQTWTKPTAVKSLFSKSKNSGIFLQKFRNIPAGVAWNITIAFSQKHWDLGQKGPWEVVPATHGPGSLKALLAERFESDSYISMLQTKPQSIPFLSPASCSRVWDTPGPSQALPKRSLCLLECRSQSQTQNHCCWTMLNTLTSWTGLKEIFIISELVGLCSPVRVSDFLKYPAWFG